MKKAIIFLFILSLPPLGVRGQNGWTKEMWDEVIASKAFKLSLVSDKGLLEASESCQLSIDLSIPPKADPNDETPELRRKSQTIKLPSGETSPYRVNNWRIVEGGGRIAANGTTATYTAPATAPANKKMTISVDLTPIEPNLPKVQLLKTIYFSQSETFFTLHIPDMGIVNAKFVTKLTSINNKMLPQQAVETIKQKGYSINGLTASAMYIYDPTQNLSVLRFSNLALEAIDTEDDGSKNIVNGNYLLAIAYRGLGAGSFDLSVENSGVNMVVGVQLGVGCGDTKEDMNCDGSIKITHEDNTYIEGYLNTIVYAGDVNGQKARGRLHGKFRAMKAN